MDDLALLERCRANCESAAAEFVRRFGPAVRRRLHHRHRVPTRDVEDVEQDILYGALQRLQSGRFVLKGKAPFLAWLWTITRAKAADYWRREAARHVALAYSLDDDEWTREGIAIEGDQYARLQINQAIAALPGRLHVVAVLHFLRGWAPAELRTALGISEPRVRFLIGLARRQVHDRLGPTHTHTHTHTACGAPRRDDHVTRSARRPPCPTN